MDNDNESMHAAVQQYLPVNGRTIYYALMAKGFKIWKVGKLYYLWIDNQPINVEITYSLNRRLYALGMLPEDKALIGKPHGEFMKLCRRHAENFDRTFKAGATPERNQEYQLARKTTVGRRVYFRRWMIETTSEQPAYESKHQEN